MWTLTTPPNWVPTAVATDKGWEHPDTGEVLVAIGKLASANGAGPAPKSVTLGSNKAKWIAGDNFDIYVNFNGDVTVTGTPRIAVTIGLNTRYANYLSGSGTGTLKFRYTLVSGDTGAISIGNAVGLNGGSVVETAQVGKLGVFTIGTAGTGYTGPLGVTFTGGTGGTGGRGVATLTDDGVSAITLTEEGSGYTGAPTVVFNKLGSGAVLTPVITGGVVTDILITDPGSGYTGIPTLTIADTGDGANAVATCTIQDGGIHSVTISNGGTSYDATTTVTVAVPGQNAAATVALKSTNATLSIAGIEPTDTMAADNAIAAPTVTVLGGLNFDTGANIVAKVVFAEDMYVTGTPNLIYVLDSVSGPALYTGADPNDPLRTFYFSYTVLETDVCLATTFTVDGTMEDPSLFTDAGGNEFDGSFTPPTTTSITVNGVALAAPTISSITAISGTKKIGDSILISVNFSMRVDVVGSPFVNFTIGTTAKTATYYSGSGTSTLVFRYVVVEGDPTGATAIGANPLDLNGGTIKNSSLVAAVITVAAPASTQTVDTTRPTITLFERLLGPSYVTDDNLDFKVTTSTAATVTGTPRIYVGIGENTRYAAYSSGTGTTELTFRYTIVAADYAPIPGQGFALDNVITLNSGTIKDAAGNDMTDLKFRRPVNTTVTVNA
jgi:large repetitive protein